MNSYNHYIGVDNFRLFAAFLVIAIHTSPLEMFSPVGDFILTRIIARLAVPFFFMASGFFLLGGCNCDSDKLKKFLKKALLIYIVAMLIYLPINIYNGYFGSENLPVTIVKDLLFDGTFYHLWYLPAGMLGGVIAWFSIKHLGVKNAILLSLFLYVIGLLGDSYFGFAQGIPFLKSVYTNLFKIFDYTRNGVFFAPIFFVLGGSIAQKKSALTLLDNLIGFSVSFLGMLAEGLFLHSLDVQRHDCMYIMLVPCVYFMFSALSFIKGERKADVSLLALSMYIIHPMVIIFVRGFAKLLGLQSLFIDNSLIHYFAVAVISLIFSYAIVKLAKHPFGHRN